MFCTQIRGGGGCGGVAAGEGGGHVVPVCSYGGFGVGGEAECGSGLEDDSCCDWVGGVAVGVEIGHHGSG